MFYLQMIFLILFLFKVKTVPSKCFAKLKIKGGGRFFSCLIPARILYPIQPNFTQREKASTWRIPISTLFQNKG